MPENYFSSSSRLFHLRWVAAVALLSILNPLALVPPASLDAQTVSTPTRGNPYPHRVAAPGLEGVEWVNVVRPLSLADFRGRFVLLDFWTYCCINCMHILPELKKLEHAYPNELVIIGVHSAKFAGEHVTENIREAAARYEIEHPIINDAQLTLWRSYGVRSWPTLVLIDPAGEVVWAASGERTFDDIKQVIDQGLPFYRGNGTLAPAPRPTLVPAAPASATPLRFPGKVLADADTKRLFIADSNHNRIVITSLEGKLQQTIGTGAIGRTDGPYNAASFNHPQGMALVENKLYVADTENHLIRKIDLAAERVATVAGTGIQGQAWAEKLGGEPVKTRTAPLPKGRSPLGKSLSSPWALWHHDKNLFIAMAGMHQIWRMSLDESRIAPYAGNGRENIADGPLLPRKPYDESFASFAQPSGLTSDGKELFVADSEGSTVRSVPLEGKGKVRTLVGLTNTLFDFGDFDGQGENVRLQHPLGVAWADGTLYVADTYNNRIKAIDVGTRFCRTIAGTGQAGNADAEKGLDATFNEPGGLAAAAGKLFVADTNNHAVRIVELAQPNRVTTVKIDDLSPPKP